MKISDKILIDTPKELADFVVDELGRWASLDCPTFFEQREFETSVFSGISSRITAPTDIRSGNDLSVGIHFVKSGFVVIKIIKGIDWLVTRFYIADPDLQSNLEKCFVDLELGVLDDFIDCYEARISWIG